MTVTATPARTAPHPDLTASDLTSVRALLGEHRQARLDQISALSATDQADSEFDPGVRARTLVKARAALADIEHAVATLDDGTYGWCAGCATPIPAERLLAVPHARHCVRCAARA